MNALDPKVVWFPRCDIVVKSYNPEMVDMDNPRGEVYGERWYCVGELIDGSRFTCFYTWDKEEALYNAQWLQDNHVDIDETMQATYPCYGSPAYMEDPWDIEENYHTN